ncbi:MULTISPECIES: universal stress protein [Natronococcus]|uniref:UspA domain-containing protein n=1 Tax=Natronococcus amylolyticus DSM 10524 TaxID=1227497 RepID=L9XCP6_9EURY|nr:universal stress protein [Natronococcus amylolyticus]ELY59412.1 UspA domain-containing protein [Natronococcus amylolyticus DSM 10524]
MAVLVAYDGSASAQKAVEYAFDSHADEEIVLLRVVEAADGSTEAGVNLLQEALRDREQEASGSLEDVTEPLDTSETEFRTETAVGKPEREVVAFAEEHDVDHIVIGSHGREGVSRVLLGSVAEKIVRRAPVPVTVVR